MADTDKSLEELQAEVEALRVRVAELEQAEAELKRAEEAVRASEEKYRSLFEHANDSIFIIDPATRRFLDVNENAARRLGYTREELLQLGIDDLYAPEASARNEAIIRELQEVGSVVFEHTHLRKDGSEMPVEVSSRVIEYGGRTVFQSFVRDITGRKRAEEERQTHLRFLESMDRVNRATQGTNDLEQMMSDVLDTVLSIFDCDRAYLVYPCDPEAASWTPPMERAKPEYPGALALGQEIPMDKDVAETFRILRASAHPVKFGPGTKHPLPTEVAEQFGIKSFMSMALYPKVGKPWQFGIHQCSYPRTWTPEEERLLQGIGRRLTDALTSLLAYRNLQESELRYRELFENSSECIFLLDVTEDARFKFAEFNPAEERAVGFSNAEVAGKFVEEAIPAELAQQVVANYRRCVEAGTMINYDEELNLPVGRRDFHTVLIPVRNAAGDIYRIVGVARDITEQRQTEQELQRSNDLLRAIIEAAPVAIIGLDLDGNVQSVWNPAAEKMLGWSIQEVLGRPPPIVPVESQEEFRHFRERVHSGQTLDGVEIRRQRRDGSPIDFSIYASPLRDTEGRITGNIAVLVDITERKRAEADFRKLSQAVQQSPASIVITDTAGNIEYVNPEFTQVTGYTRDEVLGENPRILKSGETPPEEYQRLWDTITHGGVWHGEFHNKKKNGELYWESASISPVFDSQGDIKHFVAVKEDITGRKRAEEALARRTLVLETLNRLARELTSTLEVGPILDTVARVAAQAVDATSAYVSSWDEEQRTSTVLAEYLSPQASDLERLSDLGKTYAFEDFDVSDARAWIRRPEGQWVAHVDDPELDPRERAHMEQYGAKSILEIPLVAEDKPIGVLEVWESRRKREFAEEEIDLVQAIARQASVAIDNAQLHEALWERAARLQLIQGVGRRTTAILELDQLLDQAASLINDTFDYYSTSILLVENGEIVLRAASRPSLRALVGKTRLRVGEEEGVTGRVADSGDPLLVPDVSQEPRYHYLEQAEETRSELAVPIKLKDIIIGVLDVQSAELGAFSEADTFTLQTIADQLAISIENARLYQELETHSEVLEEAVKERTAELQTANEHLQALSRVKDEFVSNVSHELRTPITSIKLHHHLLKMDPDELDDYLPVLQRETERLYSIIEGLLRLSRLDQQRVELKLAAVDLNVLASQYVADRQPLAEGKGLTLTFGGQKNLPTVQADEGLLGQVLSILLTNALNYTPSGGSVAISTQAKEEDEQLWAGFSISDTGPGIPPKEQPRLFERFFRGKVGRESGEPGTGLGLALAREIVARHRGRIEVASEGKPGKGTTFTVWLPTVGGMHG